MAQASQPMFINIPPPGSNPGTPSDMPGTPTSTTTSLSALSTTAIKDGQRGHLPHGPSSRGHSHHPSATSLEAERADRISRLAGLERVSTLRSGPPGAQQTAHHPQADDSPQTTTPTSTGGFPLHPHLTPAYFDAQGQPTAMTKISTVGTASATESYPDDDHDTRTAAGDRDEDILSTDTNYRDVGSVTSTTAEPDPDHMDEDTDGGTTRSMGGYEDRMSDDGSASLVAFGEGANSTVSGPIYHRRPVPGVTSQPGPGGHWTLERSNSGLSDTLPTTQRNRDVGGGGGGGGGDTPISASALQERREARMVDGVAADSAGLSEAEMFVDTTNRPPVPTSQLQHASSQQHLNNANQSLSSPSANRRGSR
ncbi:hypothetical protein SODALDRAFT_323874 [Sodiomyces alkalinus F11]|uniref:Uncharacterized protein n=1 Tax=Sodiomyces alkalinus (strain CBS 110278 / VKM F-3762 / F11) TaxID=1314773 RepID=A0A3N2PV60_SODAK|nr:hypothetical protein SODALDRAFT_323874 [Sodiomyces alkalinus F11]ROT38391.1 hypothetical protein SODALDRAFT_323874 [Sodiomyces alkalinus F11]